MNPKLITPAAGSVLVLGSVKDHLRIDGAAMDPQIQEAIASAEADFERKTGRALLASTWDYTIEGFPCGDSIDLPKGEVSSVTSVKYWDVAGVEHTLSSTEYDLDIPEASIELKYGHYWPADVLRTANQIVIRFVAGWPTADDVPADIKRALRVHVSAQIDPPKSPAELTRVQAIWENACLEWRRW